MISRSGALLVHPTFPESPHLLVVRTTNTGVSVRGHWALTVIRQARVVGQTQGRWTTIDWESRSDLKPYTRIA